MSDHYHVYVAPAGRTFYRHVRGLVPTGQAARQWAGRNLAGAHFRVFSCDGTDCPGGASIEVMASRSRRAPPAHRKLSRNVRARIRRRADALGVTPDQLVLQLLQSAPAGAWHGGDEPDHP